MKRIWDFVKLIGSVMAAFLIMAAVQVAVKFLRKGKKGG